MLGVQTNILVEVNTAITIVNKYYKNGSEIIAVQGKQQFMF